MHLNDGYYLNDLLFWGKSLSKESYVARAYNIRLPSMTNTSKEHKLEFDNRWKAFLRQLSQLGEQWGMQIHWGATANYKAELTRYHAQSHLTSANSSRWTNFVRHERYYRYEEAIKQGRLRREECVIFLSKKVNTLPKRGLATVHSLDLFTQQTTKSIDDNFRTLIGCVPNVDYEALSALEIRNFITRFFNPSLQLFTEHPAFSKESFDPDASILSNSLFSSGICDPDSEDLLNWKMDGCYHTLFVLRRWPKGTYPGILEHLTTAISLDYSIVQTILPLIATKELEKEERQLKRLLNEVKRRPSLEVPIERKRTKINELQRGYTTPYKVLTTVRVWDKTRQGLLDKVTTLKTAISSMLGTQYHVVDSEPQAINLFRETLPGRTGGKVREWDLYIESKNLSSLVPVSSTYTGPLDSAEIILDGNQNNLVGIELFRGGQPQHSVLIGMTGAGKSVFLNEILAQSRAYYPVTFIIDEGLSHAVTTKLEGQEPIIIHPDTDLVLNYFDTLKAPLSQVQVSAATALCMKMVGLSGDSSLDNYREGLIEAYISQLYMDVASDWLSRNESRIDFLARMAMMTLAHQKTMTAGSSFVDAYSELFLSEETNQELKIDKEILAKVGDESEVIKFTKSINGEKLLNDLVFTQLCSEEFPTHTSLVEMMLYSPLDQHDVEQVNFVATMLSSWKRIGGKNGGLFDGVTNISIKGKPVVHFELSFIPESNPKQKEAAAFLIANFVRQYIITLPRAVRKRVVFEEVARFLDVPGGEKIVSEFYAQLRKYSCWCCSVIQNYAQFQRSSSLCKIILRNSKQFFLMKQNSREEMTELGEAIGLPITVQNTILNFPLIEEQKKSERKAAYVMVVNVSGSQPTCGVVKHYPSKQMIYVADSSGSHFDNRAKALSRYSDILEAVITESEVAYSLNKNDR